MAGAQGLEPQMTESKSAVFANYTIPPKNATSHGYYRGFFPPAFLLLDKRADGEPETLVAI